MASAPRRWALFDWGGTLMAEEGGPLDVPMALWPEVAAIEGARETLAALSMRYGIGVATNASVSQRNMVEIALGRVGLRGYVSEVFCYADIGARKESTEFWRAALDRLGVEPDDIAMVGDSLGPDVIAPRDMGIYAVWFNRERRAERPRDIPVVESLVECVPLIDAHFGRRP